MSFYFSVDEFLSHGLIFLLCLLICVFLSGKATWERFFSKLPPGPWGLPIIGNTFIVVASFLLYVLDKVVSSFC